MDKPASKPSVFAEDMDRVWKEEEKRSALLGASTARLSAAFELGFEVKEEQTETLVVLDVDPQTGEIVSVNGAGREGSIVITTKIVPDDAGSIMMQAVEDVELSPEVKEQVNRAIGLWNNERKRKASLHSYAQMSAMNTFEMPAISEVKSFEELFLVLQNLKTLKGSTKEYTADELIRGINFAREVENPSELLKFVTSAGGLRDKVSDLIRAERLKKNVQK